MYNCFIGIEYNSSAYIFLLIYIQISSYITELLFNYQFCGTAFFSIPRYGKILENISCTTGAAIVPP